MSDSSREASPVNWGMIIALATAVAIVMQAAIMKEQLTSSDRYQAYRSATTDLYNLCSEYDRLPLTRGTFVQRMRDEKGDQYEQIAIDIAKLEDITSQSTIDYVTSIVGVRRQAITSLMQLRYWVKSGRKSEALSAALGSIADSSDPRKLLLMETKSEFWAHFKDSMLDCYQTQIDLTSALFDDDSFSNVEIANIEVFDEGDSTAPSPADE